MGRRLLPLILFVCIVPDIQAQIVTPDSALAPVVAQDTVSTAAPEVENHTKFELAVALGLTLGNHSAEEDETFTATWLSGLDSRLYSERGNDQIEITTRIRYGQVHSADAPPEKTEDDLILSVTPSIDLPLTGLRLFLENTAETQMRPGEVDSIKSGFLDPLILYEALFVGKRYAHDAEDGSSSFDFTGGVGYALQQTVANQFVLSQNRDVVISEHNPLGDVQSDVTLESGYCAILSFNLKKKLSENAGFRASLKAVALTKDDVRVSISNARTTGLLSFGFRYSLISLDYSGHLIYDRNISIKRQLDQSLVFGLRLEL
jgi:hypothetical protein